jgi:DNA-binding NtrC family response regulator
MPRQIVIAHDDTGFLDRASSALREAGYDDISVFSDSTAAVLALAGSVELLITRIAFPSGIHAGIALALMARRSRPGIQIVFAALPQFRERARGLGEFIAMPVNIADLVATVKRLMG